MKIVSTFFLFSFLSLVCMNQTYATVYNAIANGEWNETTIWDQGSVPGSLDTVAIDGYIVTIGNITGNVTVKRLTLTNASNVGFSQLVIMEAVTVTVTDDLEATAENINQDVEVAIQDNATLNVNGNVNFTRVNTNNTMAMLLLYLRNTSSMNIDGSFTYDYKNGRFNENNEEIFIEENAILDVTGNTYLYMRGGKNFDFITEWTTQAILRGDLLAQMSGGDKMTITTRDNSHFQVAGNATVINTGGTTYAMLHADGSDGKFTIGGNLTMNSTVTDKIVYLEATNSNCVIDVGGDISMSALSEGDVYVDLKASSNLIIAGDFLRPTNYGALLMSGGSTLTYDGIVSQVLADAYLAGSGTDSFNITNVQLNNTAGLILEDTVQISGNLNLLNGIITTTLTNILIIGDGATITGASESAYIDGPMIKKGSSVSNFIFPIGDENNYAPIEISVITNSASQFMAQYFGDPPPFGNNLASDVDNISGNQYWELSKIVGSDDVDIILYWMDADAKGINNLDSLVVVGLNGSNVWESFGNGGTTGSAGPGSPGSVSSTDGDPPPFGVEKFTLGSVSELNALPVELTYFEAIQREGKVDLKWQTASEINTSHFVVEHSNDGYKFEEIETVLSKGDSEFTQDYLATDISPFSGINYYRLKMVDKDGQYEYSPVEVVNFQKSQVLSIYPNPVHKVLHLIKGENPITDDGILEVFGINGQLIYKGTCVIENGIVQIATNEINIDTPGNYILRFTSAKGNHVLKFNKL